MARVSPLGGHLPPICVDGVSSVADDASSHSVQVQIDPTESVEAHNALLRDWEEIYDTIRPHQALGLPHPE